MTEVTLLWALCGSVLGLCAASWLMARIDSGRIPIVLRTLVEPAQPIGPGAPSGPSRLPRLTLLILAVVLAFVHSLVFAITVLGCGQVVMQWMTHKALVRWRRMVDGDLPDALRAMSADLARGATLRAAVELQARTDPGPLGAIWQRTLDESRIGKPIPEALVDIAKGAELISLGQMALAVSIANERGGRLAPVFDEVADAVGSLADLDGKLRALTAQGRMQMMVMAALPLVFVVLVSRTDPEGLTLMMTTPHGQAIGLGIIACEIVGVLLFRRVVGVSL